MSQTKSIFSFTEFLYFTDFLNELLKLRKKRTEAFKAGKSKGRINDFELSDDEGKHGRTKRVSFLKSQRIRSPSEDTTTSESRGNELLDDSISGNNSYNDSVSPQQSTNTCENNTPFNNSGVETTDSQITRESSSKSVSYQTSDDTLMDMPLPLPSDSSVTVTPGPEFPHPSESDVNHVSSVGLFTRFYLQATKGTLHVNFYKNK